MPRYFFALIVLLHSLIHVLGFLKAYGYGNAQQFANEISKPMGFAWLLVALLFLTAEILFLLKKNNWWMVALPAVLFSQILVIVYWHDAKFGSIANMIILIVVIVGCAEWNFNKMIQKEIAVMLDGPVHQQRIVTYEMISSLPPVVQKWMQHSGMIGKQMTQTVRLRQQGMMRSKPGAKWMKFTATQYFTVGKPAFNWQVKVNMMPLLHMNGRDKYEHGKGEMLISLLSLKTIVDSKGSMEIDQGTLLRYLAEICWFPSAAMNHYIKWQPINDSSARATMNFNNIAASGTFFFTRHGDVAGFEAMRYGEFDGKTSLEKWHIELNEYKAFDGIRIPAKAEVTWKLKEGNFTWLKLELLTVEYNEQGLFKD